MSKLLCQAKVSILATANFGAQIRGLDTKIHRFLLTDRNRMYPSLSEEAFITRPGVETAAHEPFAVGQEVSTSKVRKPYKAFVYEANAYDVPPPVFFFNAGGIS